MAAGTMPAPGTEYGPCEPVCKHLDCAATREYAESLCRFCGLRIGYETRYYAPYGIPEHAKCAEEDAERVAAK